MSIWGKIVGGVAGFALGGPLGALLGAAAGHAVDRMRGNGQGEAGPQGAGGPWGPSSADTATRQIAFSVAVIVLGAKMAKSDGHVSTVEIAAFKQAFRVPSAEMGSVGKLFTEARRDALGFEPYARQIAGLFAAEPQVLEKLLAGLFHIAKADGVVKPAEAEYLAKVAEVFGLDGSAFARARAAADGGQAADPYQVLGVARTADNAAIKAAYRSLIRTHHPDTLVSKGMPPEFVHTAHEEMAAINVAYDRVAKERGLR